MKASGKFILLSPGELNGWLNNQVITRKIKLIQHHHTYIPAYKHFKTDNHFELCRNMERSHLERGFAEIAQNLTTFPDGKIMVCRNLDTIPAGIKGANSMGICIENLGNFDAGNDIMKKIHRKTIISLTRALLDFFGLTASEDTVVYHHWYDLTLGARIRTQGAGVTKTCPGTAFFGGNTVDAFRENFLKLLV